MEFYNIFFYSFNILALVFGTLIRFPAPSSADEVQFLITITRHARFSLPFIFTVLQQVSVWTSFMEAVFRIKLVFNPCKLTKLKKIRLFSILIYILLWTKFPEAFKELLVIKSYHSTGNQTVVNGNYMNESNFVFFVKNSSLSIFPIMSTITLHLIASAILVHKILVVGNINRCFTYVSLMLNFINMLVQCTVILVLFMYMILRPNQILPFELNF